MSNNFETRKYCSSCNLKKGNTLQIVVFPWNDMTNRQTSLSILLKMVVMVIIQKRTVSK